MSVQSARIARGLAAVAVGDPDFGTNDPHTSAVDTIANVLHWLAEVDTSDVDREASARIALQSAQGHFEAERYDDQIAAEEH